MIRNYMKIAWRNLFRQKIFTLINIAGLALGLCACLVIYSIVYFEFTFDTFHPGRNRIYRVMGDVTESTGDKLHFAKIPPAALPQVRNNLPGMETVAAIIPFNTPIIIPEIDDVPKVFASRQPGLQYPTTVIAEPGYFKIFSYEWLAGNPDHSLDAPFSVVLTEKRAYQYFGDKSLDKMIGRQVIYQDSLAVTVTGIIKDWSKNTDLPFTDFISYRTLSGSFLRNIISLDTWKQNSMSAWTFVRLQKGIDATQVSSQLAAISKSHAGPEFKLELALEPLSEMHFNSNIIENPVRTAHKPTLYVLIAIALFILTLAVINFINLSTAQSIRRVKEIGVRKVLGSKRTSLIFQFFAETAIITLFAITIAVALVTPALNLFHAFIPPGVSFRLVNISTISFIVFVSVITILLAGFYPAKLLSSYKPALSLKGIIQTKSDGWFVRKGLIVFQFTVSLVFITGSLVIGNQLKYVQQKDHGFKADAILILETPREGPVKTALFADQLKKISGISRVAIQWMPPMSENPRRMKLKLKNTGDNDFSVTQVAGNEDFIPLYSMKILAGRNLAKADSVNEFVINESLCRYIGLTDPQLAIGKTLYWNDKPYPVVGVVADFHTSSFHDPITPLCIINRPDRMGSVAVKLSSGPAAMKTVLMGIETAWKQIYPSSVFAYRFYDETIALLYEKDQQAAMLISASTAITIFISCLGLFGLALFVSQRRAKEISIRKTLGAGITDIIVMLNKDFAVLVVIAVLLATPLAWYFSDQWLQGFVYRVHIGAGVFVLAGATALGIAMLTVSFQSVKAALVNPVENLRSE